MHYIDKNGLVLEILQTGERLFNGQPCTMKLEENSIYSICLDDSEFYIKLGKTNFEILNSDVIVKPYVGLPHDNIIITTTPNQNVSENNKISYVSKNGRKFIKRTTLVVIDCVDLNRAIKCIKQCLEFCEFEKVKLLSSIPGNYEYIINIPKISSIQEYSRFCIKELAKYIDTDFCLIFQHDGWIINGNNWNDEWFNYDYIGCQTVWTEPGENGKGGNGGVSFRSKKLLELGKFIPDNKTHPEDTVISSIDNSKNGNRNFFEKHGCKIASSAVQKYFGWEYGINHVKQFASHQTKQFLNFESESLTSHKKIFEIKPDVIYSFGEYNSGEFIHLWGLQFDESGFTKTNHHENETSYTYLNTGELVIKNKNGFYTSIFEQKINENVVIGRFAGGKYMYLKPLVPFLQYQQLEQFTDNKKVLAWYICFGENEAQYTNISINSLVNIGRFNGDIVVITDCPHKFNKNIKTFFYKSPNDIKKIWNCKYLINNFIDILKYDICLYSDSDILFTQNINKYLNQKFNVLHNEYQYIVGSRHESSGGQLLSTSQIKNYFNVSVCAGLFFGSSTIISNILEKHKELTNKKEHILHDQGVLIKIILENYINETFYIKDSNWREYNNGCAFVHFSNTKSRMKDVYESLLANNTY